MEGKITMKMLQKIKKIVKDRKTEDEFVTKITPLELDNGEELGLMKCKCGHVHFRHAGYVHMAMPYIDPGKGCSVSQDTTQVHLCVKCKKSYVWYSGQLYDISRLIDVDAWKKSEQLAHKATGPGGQC